jgi:hypothetical protein
MPGVDTIEALTAAVRAFDAQPLGLEVDADAEAAVRQSLERTGLVLLGEIHGVAQTPVLLDELIRWFGLGGIALEWDEGLGAWLDRWLNDGVLDDAGQSILTWQVWSGDGRVTAGHLAMLRRWAASGLLITLMDGTTIWNPGEGQSAEEYERRFWSERDAAMARRVLAAPDAVGGRLVAAGGLHTKLEPLPDDHHPIAAQIGVPMGVELARQRPGLCSIDCIYGPGGFYNLGPQDISEPLPGRQVNAPRLVRQEGGDLQLLVPSTREATVPHRELPDAYQWDGAVPPDALGEA